MASDGFAKPQAAARHLVLVLLGILAASTGCAGLTNPAADLSTVPDGVYVSYDALQSGRVRQVSGRRAGVIELEGTPEMVLEVVSDTSVEKDMVLLPELYHRAGIPEFWRVDARGAELRFEVLRRTEGGYEPAQESDGWWRSEAFGASFQLTR